ncbi:MAG: hypothetical protein ACU836_16290, partial [Gammaproteobacteria bacterium]
MLPAPEHLLAFRIDLVSVHFAVDQSGKPGRVCQRSVGVRSGSLPAQTIRVADHGDRGHRHRRAGD